MEEISHISENIPNEVPEKTPPEIPYSLVSGQLSTWTKSRNVLRQKHIIRSFIAQRGVVQPLNQTSFPTYMQNTSESANLTPLRVHDGIILRQASLDGWNIREIYPFSLPRPFLRHISALWVGRVDLGLLHPSHCCDLCFQIWWKLSGTTEIYS